jgi:hypothetical protein
MTIDPSHSRVSFTGFSGIEAVFGRSVGPEIWVFTSRWFIKSGTSVNRGTISESVNFRISTNGIVEIFQVLDLTGIEISTIIIWSVMSTIEMSVVEIIRVNTGSVISVSVTYEVSVSVSDLNGMMTVVDDLGDVIPVIEFNS